MPSKYSVDECTALITQQCQSLRTYQPEFGITIRNFAELLAERDCIYEKFLAEGGSAVTIHRSDRGSINHVKNPLLLIWLDLTAEARKYAGELGLTARSLRTLSDAKIPPPKKESELSRIIRELENEK